MNEISAKYFSSNFIARYKLKLSDVVILEYIYSWLLSDNPPESIIVNKKKYFYLSQSHIVRDYNLLITQPSISRKIKNFQRCDIIYKTYFEQDKFYVCFNWDKVLESLAPRELLNKQKYYFNSDWFVKIFDFIEEEKVLESQDEIISNKSSEPLGWHDKINSFIEEQESYNKNEEENMAGLLDDEDMQKKAYYCKQADAIAKRILKKYGTIFTTKYPLDGQEPTKTYIRICTKITDIYNGHFTSSRFYDFDENVFKNKQFDTEGWREKLQEARSDWAKVKKLIFDAIENFLLMFDENRMPMKKDYLTSNLNDWFFSDNPNNKGQSQFIQSLNEPMYVKQKLGLDKAKGIVEEMKEKSPVSYLAGHELNELLPENANEASAWTFIQGIIKWGKLLYQYDNNAKYFLQCKIGNNLESGPKVLPALFARYLKENNIGVSLNTLNIEQAIDSNAPWCWFIQDACCKHNINSNVVRCLDEDDFYDAYNDKKISFDDMETVVF